MRSRFTKTPAGRPVVCGVPAPLSETSPEAWWAEEVTKRGLNSKVLMEQVRLADSILAEILGGES